MKKGQSSRRNGNLRKRTSQNRSLNVGLGYIAVTDGDTEEEYLKSLKKSIDFRSGKKFPLMVKKVKTSDVLEKCEKLSESMAELKQIWLVIDKDEIKDFDNFIRKAEKINRVKVIWSNPCFEVWFLEHFGRTKFFNTPEECYKTFGRIYEEQTGNRYDKSRKITSGIYNFLSNNGDEKQAIIKSRNRFEHHLKSGRNKPSDMNPCTKMFEVMEQVDEFLEQRMD